MNFRLIKSFGIFKIGKYTKDNGEHVCYEAYFPIDEGKIKYKRSKDLEAVKDWLDAEMKLAEADL